MIPKIFSRNTYSLSSLAALVVPGFLAFGGPLVAPASAEEIKAEPAPAEERIWGVSTAVGIFSEYMFRGKNVYEGTSIQPSITPYVLVGENGTLSANFWLQVPGESAEPPERFNELDYTLSYDHDFDFMTLSAGHIFYTFPGDGGRITDTREYFLSASVPMVLNPSVTFYNDYDEAKYQYYTLTLRDEVEVPFVGEGASLTPYVTFGFATNANDGPIFYFDNGLEHIDVGASTNLPWGDVVFTPQVHFTFKVDDGTNNEFWFGLEVGYDI